MPALFSAAELAEIAGGVWSGDVSRLPERFELLTDTRQDGRGKLFLALSGENFDGHAFLKQAAAGGCCGVCVRKDFTGELPELPVLAVDDVLKTFQLAARCHRQRFRQLAVAGVTGSVGKTSTKEMLRAIFTEYTGDPEQVLYTIGNTNNHIGVPQNLLRLNENHRFAVIEMGTSSPGEILPLTRIALPDAAAVNAVAACHLENLGDLDGVASEKSAIYSGLPENGTAIMGKHIHGREILERAAGKRRKMIFGSDPAGCDVAAEFISGDLNGSCFKLHFSGSGNVFTVRWALAGMHQVLNAACAACAALSLGVPEKIIADGLSHTVLPGMRMKRTVIDGIEFINDAYNANPVSMQAVLTMVKTQIKPENLVLVIGGMRELGERSVCEHQRLLVLIRSGLSGARLITVGREFAGLADNGKFFEDSTQAREYLAGILKKGDTVLAKGSRGNHVELALPEEAR